MPPSRIIAVKIDWRRGPRELRVALDQARHKVLEDVGAEIRRTAPHPSLADAVIVQLSQVKIVHPAAWFWEVGVSKKWRGPPAGLVEWAQRHGKNLREAFAVARAGVNIPASPYIGPAVSKMMGRVGTKFREIWGH